MPAVPLQCPSCAGLIQIDVSLAGQAVACPLCQAPMGVPPEEILLQMLAAGGEAPPPAPPAEVQTLACPACTGPFQAPTSMAGHQVLCPHCGTAVTIAGFEAPAEAAPPVSPPLETGPPLFGASDWAPRFEPPSASPEIGPPAAGRDSPGPPPTAAEDLLPPRKAAPRETRPSAGDLFPPQRAPADDLLPPAFKSEKKPQIRPREPASERSPPASPKRGAESDLLPPVAATRSPPAAAAPSINDLLPPQESLAPGGAKRRSGPAIDDLLPPGAADSGDPFPASSAGPALDGLLPPGAEDGSFTPAAAGPPAVSALDALLPPGMGGATAVPATEQVAIPAAPKRSPARHLNVPSNAILVPTPEGGFVPVADSPKTIGEGADAVEIRRLTPQEKARRRFRKNLILGGFCLAILVVVLVIMIWQ